MAPSVVEALALACEPARTPVVCVAGSLFLVGEALARLGGAPGRPCAIEK
jgi:hypothetical protein